MPTSVLKGLSPFERMKKKPSIDHLRVFDYFFNAKVLPSADTFDFWSISYIMMGYSLTQKGYKLVNLENNTFFWLVVRKSLLKTIFPFKHNNHEIGNLFVDVVGNIFDDNKFLEMTKPSNIDDSDKNNAEDDDVTPYILDNSDSVEINDTMYDEPTI